MTVARRSSRTHAGAAADEHPAAVDEQHRRHIDGPIEIVTPSGLPRRFRSSAPARLRCGSACHRQPRGRPPERSAPASSCCRRARRITANGIIHSSSSQPVTGRVHAECRSTPVTRANPLDTARNLPGPPRIGHSFECSRIACTGPLDHMRRIQPLSTQNRTLLAVRRILILRDDRQLVGRTERTPRRTRRRTAGRPRPRRRGRHVPPTGGGTAPLLR